MDRNVTLTLTGCQRDPEGNETATKLSAAAEYFEQNGVLYIFYEESTEEGSKIKNRIKLKGLLLEVVKRGAVNTRMIFEVGGEHTMEYATPIGNLRMDILTHSVETDKSDDEQIIAADYSLTSDGTEISRCKISIKIHNREFP